MDKLKQYKWLVLFGFVIIAGVFYWYQIRPAIIKHNCSWVKRHEDAKPANPGVTQAEADINKQKEATCNLKATSAFDRLNCKYAAPTSYVSPQPAVPAKDWYASANKNEYDFCLHDKGL
jgi:hypothetical protein